MATAIVTGGGSGIGAATAVALHEAGHDVVAVGLDRTDELPDHIRFETLDISDKNEAAAFFQSFDEISALVNCAGILRHQREWEPDHFSAVLDVNLTAVLNGANAAKTALARAGGSVVNIASMWSYFGSPGSPGYAASKAGVVALTRSMATAWAKDGIRVNAVAPGWIKTQLAAKAFNDAERSKKINERIPMGEWGEPDDIAAVIRFLVSKEARYVTGVLLPVDGGYSIG